MPRRADDPWAEFDLLDPRKTLRIHEAASLLGVTSQIIRRAIKEGDLPAFIPMGLEPTRTGRQGYRIWPRDLRRWFFGSAGEKKEDQA